jgi:putative transposase
MGRSSACGLQLIFLIIIRAVSLLGLSRREEWQKDAEILMLRHQLAVAERRQPRARLRPTWPDRALLALLAGTVPAECLAAMRLIVSPGTVLRWHRDIVCRRWARRSRQGRSSRPAKHRRVRSAVLRLARENEARDYRRIHDELAGLGITVAPSTIWQILKDADISPAPRPEGRGGRSSCGPRRMGAWCWTSSAPAPSTARRSTSWPLSSTAPAASGSSAPLSTQSSRG